MVRQLLPSNGDRQLDTALDRISLAIQRCFEVDLRALAVFRIALGTLILIDLLNRSRNFVAFHTDAGVLPRAALFSDYSDVYSIHAISGEPWVQALLFCVAGAFAISLIVGYQTRAVTIVSWLLLLSLHARNPMILNAGDTLLRMLVFWSIFLPLGERWSIDARRIDRDRSTVASMASLALLCQVVLMYVTNAIHKSESDVWLEGDALVYIFNADHLTYVLGNAIADQHALLTAFTHVWMALILISPFLILLTGWQRAVLATLFVGMHLGMFVTLRIDLFPVIVVVAFIPFYQSAVWDGLATAAARVGLADRLRRGLNRLQADVPSVPTPGSGPTVLDSVPNGRLLFSTILPWLFLVLVVLSNAEAVGYSEVPDPAEDVVDAAQIDQSWRMFAPNPSSTAQWFIAPGELEDGSKVDVLHESEVDRDRPPNAEQTYDSSRWRKYLTTMRYANNENHRSYLGNHLCERWNSTYDTELETVTIYGMSDRSDPYEENESVSEVTLIEYDCSGEFVQDDD